ncbi:TrmB family transcriptional regulator sugar-binding domain-containing protein [Streptomyces sp. HSW2009]|uniref:helix-turn-helix transcriptional regulator n=1 Tax=Streptomyces sp. HSW2009 TaxID=3142890 RepID=UPI0032EACCD5
MSAAQREAAGAAYAHPADRPRRTEAAPLEFVDRSVPGVRGATGQADGAWAGLAWADARGPEIRSVQPRPVGPRSFDPRVAEVDAPRGADPYAGNAYPADPYPADPYPARSYPRARYHGDARRAGGRGAARGFDGMSGALRGGAYADPEPAGGAYADLESAGGAYAARETAGGEGATCGDPDAVEHALRQVCELIESAVTLHRRTAEQPAAVMVADDGPAARRTVHQLIAQARRGVSVIVSGVPEQAQSLAPLLEQLAAAGSRGVAVRVLCAAQALETPGLATAVRRGLAGHEVRVETGDLQGGVIVDGQTAFVHAGPGHPGRYASVVEDPASVRVLDLMFAAAWRTAMPIGEHLRLADRLRTDSVRKILDRLRAGRTDDVAAREIQVSLRTYRRHVAAIMREVGANSRFQAGVRAYELGLLGPA